MKAAILAAVLVLLAACDRQPQPPMGLHMRCVFIPENSLMECRGIALPAGLAQ